MAMDFSGGSKNLMVICLNIQTTQDMKTEDPLITGHLVRRGRGPIRIDYWHHFQTSQSLDIRYIKVCGLVRPERELLIDYLSVVFL